MIKGAGEDCPKCYQPMERRAWIKPPHTRTYYYKEWDVCHKCKHIQHYEQYKSTDWQETEQQQSFFNSLRNQNE